MNLDSIDKNIINLVQIQFPLTMEPYADLGLRLGIDGEEVIGRIGQLKAKSLIRQISPVLDTRRLGYQSTLVAMRVAESQLDEAAQVISEHRGVSHNYQRDHYFNLWFTLATPPTVDIETELQRLTSSITAEAIFTLPVIKLFKIAVYFAMDGDSEPVADMVTPPVGVLPEKVELSPIDRLVINELQQDLPLVATPFTGMAARLSMDVEHFLAHCQSLLQRGIMRRFAASLNHIRSGFTANAMTCWVVPPGKVDIIGQRLATLPEVSHCYERKTNPLWRYNLFAMIHGHTREACQEIATRVSAETGLTDYVLLFSTKEFKKTRIEYLV